MVIGLRTQDPGCHPEIHAACLQLCGQIGEHALTKERLAELARLFETEGLPPLWARRPAFPTLIRIILGRLTPDRVLGAGARYRSPSAKRQIEIADNWRPFRSVAARMLWNHYLGTR